jgi:outer membrane protein OmpA-like peptidoglycan-associated protein
VKSFKLVVLLAMVIGLSGCSIGDTDFSTMGPGSREVNAVLILDPVEDMPNVVKIRQKVLFDFDSYKLDAVAESTVEAVAILMKEHPDTLLILEGHTDKYGTNEYNDYLSLNRSEAVKAVLVDEGIDEDRINVVGYGKTRLIMDLSNRENRRVLILSIDE